MFQGQGRLNIIYLHRYRVIICDSIKAMTDERHVRAQKPRANVEEKKIEKSAGISTDDKELVIIVGGGIFYIGVI